MEHVLRSWLIAGRLGDRQGLGAEARVTLYYVMMLAWVGCVADSAEVAAWFGDDLGRPARLGENPVIGGVPLPARGVLASGQAVFEILDPAEYERIRSQAAAPADHMI